MSQAQAVVKVSNIKLTELGENQSLPEDFPNGYLSDKEGQSPQIE